MNLLGRESLIAADNTWGLLGVMCLAVAFSIFLEQKYKWASKISGAIIALIIAMILANVGIIPTSSVLYDDIVWGVIVPMGIPLLLLQCNLSRIWKDTGRMLIVWIIGAVGTTVGAFVAYFLLLRRCLRSGQGRLDDDRLLHRRRRELRCHGIPVCRRRGPDRCGYRGR